MSHKDNVVKKHNFSLRSKQVLRLGSRKKHGFYVKSLEYTFVVEKKIIINGNSIIRLYVAIYSTSRNRTDTIIGGVFVNFS